MDLVAANVEGDSAALKNDLASQVRIILEGQSAYDGPRSQ